MKKVIMAFPGNEIFANLICNAVDGLRGDIVLRKFPDGETYVKLITDVFNNEVVVVCTLDRPDNKILPLLFLLRLLREAGVSKITLAAPYLSYMRQDKQFTAGEAVTSKYFGELLSPFIDKLVTIDPHLHRRKSISEIYNASCNVLHASDHVSLWIKKSVENPVLIGPDSESEQWVSKVAAQAGSPYIILQKERHGDRDVDITVPNMQEFKNRTPVLVDDIISTAHTMMETSKHLKELGFNPPVCVGVHAVFADQSYKELLQTGVKQIVTSNTIPHETNGIDLSPLIIESIKND
jgi:ribose-phosphate pyrophosphokinase